VRPIQEIQLSLYSGISGSLHEPVDGATTDQFTALIIHFVSPL